MTTFEYMHLGPIEDDQLAVTLNAVGRHSWEAFHISTRTVLASDSPSARRFHDVVFKRARSPAG